MIKSYRDKLTQKFAEGEFVKAFERFSSVAERKLASLNDSESLDDLRSIRGNYLEALKRERLGQHSIRINDKWRICFVWNHLERCAEEVEITDYH